MHAQPARQQRHSNLYKRKLRVQHGSNGVPFSFTAVDVLFLLNCFTSCPLHYLLFSSFRHVPLGLDVNSYYPSAGAHRCFGQHAAFSSKANVLRCWQCLCTLTAQQVETACSQRRLEHAGALASKDQAGLFLCPLKAMVV